MMAQDEPEFVNFWENVAILIRQKCELRQGLREKLQDEKSGFKSDSVE